MLRKLLSLEQIKYLSKLTLTCQCVTSKEISAAFHKAEAMLCNLGRGSADLSNSLQYNFGRIADDLGSSQCCLRTVTTGTAGGSAGEARTGFARAPTILQFFSLCPSRCLCNRQPEESYKNVNQALEELLNMTSEHLVSKPFVTFCPLKSDQSLLRLSGSAIPGTCPDLGYNPEVTQR